MTETLREQWKAAKAEVARIMKIRADLVAHTNKEYDAAWKRLDEIEEKIGDSQYSRWCEECGDPIFTCDPDWDLCEGCTPTYRDMMKNHSSFLNGDGEEMTFDQAKAICDAHVAAGGSLDDKMVA